MKSKQMIRNAASSVFVYGFLLIFSIITSKFILVGYGSETNGLLSSVNNIFSYIALLEAGIGTATITALYKPLTEKNAESTLDILAASKKYYRVSAIWYTVCMLLVAVIWPFLLDTDISYWTIFWLIFLQGVSGVLTFSLASTVTNYLVASGKNYVNNKVHFVISITTYMLRVVICSMGWSVVVISLALVLVNLAKCVFYLAYMKKEIPDFFIRKKADTSLLKQRNSFLVHEISSVIFSGTDTIVLSIFCGLTEASIYAVYSMVILNLRSLIGQVFQGTNYILGESYSKSKESYPETHDAYNAVYICVVFIAFTVAYLLLSPFVSLYTQGVSDANYIDPKLPLLFVLIELLSACRVVDNQVIKNALHAKQTLGRTIAEACINLVASLILVQFLGMYGVLLGTIIALLYRTNDVILYTNKKILKRTAWKSYGLYAINFAVFAAFIWTRKRLNIQAESFLELIVIAVGVCVGVAIVYVCVNLLFNSKKILQLLNAYKKK